MGKFIQTNDPSKVDASPTKAFFVSIITKDVQLDEAIEDLVDNSVDGARRLRPKEDYKGLSVEITCSKGKFEISDNCGGIPIDIARDYAFKFGRAEGFEETPHSVGQFGIGMKRALFKMGREFKVATTEPNARYTIGVDVAKWVGDPVNWDFDITDLEERKFKEPKLGTKITVTELEDGARELFTQQFFLDRLRNNIRISQQHPINAGLVIKFNGETIIAPRWKLLSGEGLAPAHIEYEDDLGGSSPLKTRIFVGVGESSREHAGWYIFCNGRNILEADQSRTTGWNEANDDGTKIPRYHGQFARFRGYAFLDSDDASLLPWNTTKTDLAPETAAYRRLKQRLIEAARPVIDFLNKLDAEKDLAEEDRSLEQTVDESALRPLEKLPANAAFRYSEPPKKGPPMSTISFRKPREEAFRLRDETNSSSLKDLGIFCFDYTYADLLPGDES